MSANRKDGVMSIYRLSCHPNAPAEPVGYVWRLVLAAYSWMDGSFKQYVVFECSSCRQSIASDITRESVAPAKGEC